MRLALLLLFLASFNGFAQERSKGETLYLPIYSHIWHGDVGRDGKPEKTLMSVSVSIRNTDLANPIRVTSAQYYDTDGKKLKEYIQKPSVIGPMGTQELFIARSDDRGGSGANFVITWSADAPASPPVVEGLHANLPGGRAIVFTTSARRIPQ
ncbi:MAG TPA: DUF3124 domain-containing protein [Burkholderiales bacterium]|nr:DUF3124 domain-containing protein [Burkholderiales bacterium]